jgi:citrate synthase
MSKFWRTAISQVKPNEILVRGYPIEQLIRRCSFGDVVYLLLTGELPRRQQGRLIEAILVAVCEHSLASPSVDAVRFVASTGVPLQTAVAAGICAIGDVHGGAIEPCAKLLQQAVAKRQNAKQILAELKRQGQRLPGFGHPVHKEDPRTAVLLAIGEELGLCGAHTKLVRELEEQSEKYAGKRLPLNVDGAIAALMSDLNIDPSLGKAFFIIGRAPGCTAHAHEQMTKEKLFKAAGHQQITYTGPGRRDVPAKHAKIR